MAHLGVFRHLSGVNNYLGCFPTGCILAYHNVTPSFYSTVCVRSQVDVTPLSLVLLPVIIYLKSVLLFHKENEITQEKSRLTTTPSFVLLLTLTN